MKWETALAEVVCASGHDSFLVFVNNNSVIKLNTDAMLYQYVSYFSGIAGIRRRAAQERIC